MTEFRTYVVKISEESEDRFPFGFSPSDPKTTTTIAGDFDFPWISNLPPEANSAHMPAFPTI